MTRGMLAAVLWRMAGEPEPPENRDDPFVDVDAEQYYASAVYWARKTVSCTASARTDSRRRSL